MSKKRKFMNMPRFSTISTADSDNTLTEGLSGEYSIIKKELIKLLVLNTAILALILILYFYDKQSGFLDRIYSMIF